MDERKFQRNWEMLNMLINADATGKAPKPLASKRTLFGIRSEVELAMDRIAAEMQEKLSANDNVCDEEKDCTA